jgi:hypothetical protein
MPKILLATLSLALVFASRDAVLAQRTTANIYGMVRDSSDAVTPGITVQFINEQTGIQERVVTNENGEFVANFLPVGFYTILVEAPGFKTYRQRALELSAGQQIRHLITLEVGEVTQEIEVIADAPLLQNASVQQIASLSTLQIQELPQAARDFTRLLTLQPGAVRNTTEFLQINGLPGIGITVTVDGVDASGDPEGPSLSNFQGRNLINVMSQEAIQEVNINKGVISAEIGRAYSGNINLVSKGGTNEFHGSVFENWQNDVLNARYALLAPTASKPPIRFNQFGGSVGGPVIRDKAFFFFAYEGYRQSNATIVTGLVPTAEIKAQAIAAVPAYKQLLDFFPNPTETYAPGALGAFFQGTGADVGRDNHFVIRGDYSIRQTDRLSGRYTRGRPFRILPTIIPLNPQSMTYTSDSGNLSWVHSANGWTQETRVGVNSNAARREDEAFSQSIPGIELQGQWSIGAELLTNSGHTYSVEDIVSKFRGRHTLKFGGGYFVLTPGRSDEEIPVFRYGNLADLLANRANRVQFTFGVPRFHGRTWNLAGFVQDDFRVNSKLVVNLGLRYEFYSVFKDKEGLILNPGSEANAYAIPPRFRPADSIYNADKNNFLPRVGFAWSPGQAGKNVVRAGLGMSVAPLGLRQFYTLVAYDPQIVFRYRFAGSDITRLNLLYPITNPQMIDKVRNENVPRSFQIFDENNPNPYAIQWTLDIQHQISSTLVLQTGYVGTRGLKITMNHRSNQPDRVTGIRPFPAVLESLQRDASDNSKYHAWQTSLRKRFSSDFSFNVNYTWSKTLALGQADYWGGNDVVAQDEKNRRDSYGPINEDRNHRITLDFIYAPFDRWLGANAAARHLIGGWRLSGIVSGSSGAPINVTQSSSYSGSRPDYNGADPILTGDRFHYLNPAAFTLVPVAAASGATIRPGNVGKNAFRGPGVWNLDLSLMKEVRFAERYDLTFRADMFNATNSVHLGSPISEVTRTDFGQIRTVASARTMQLGLKLNF